jgi:hypothetical protein
MVRGPHPHRVPESRGESRSGGAVSRWYDGFCGAAASGDSSGRRAASAVCTAQGQRLRQQKRSGCLRRPKQDCPKSRHECRRWSLQRCRANRDSGCSVACPRRPMQWWTRRSGACRQHLPAALLRLRRGSAGMCPRGHGVCSRGGGLPCATTAAHGARVVELAPRFTCRHARRGVPCGRRSGGGSGSIGASTSTCTGGRTTGQKRHS